ncbi:MAG TPA: ECF-type sigma factor [Bryobacteraceae bacterium]|nr:ECF-type sigma factor [Bryobacteraceae bacterium]
MATASDSQDITGLLCAWNKGDEEALNDLMPLVYRDLRAIARQHLRRCLPGQTLQSGALANEAYLRLVHARGIRCQNRGHFFALCAQLIRRILVDRARKQRYAKRGGGQVAVPLDQALLGTKARGVELEALDEALTALAKIDARKSRVVELRFFGGLTWKKRPRYWKFRRKQLRGIGEWPRRGCFANLPAPAGSSRPSYKKTTHSGQPLYADGKRRIL